MPGNDLKHVVKDKYGKAALRVTTGGDASCCGGASERGDRDPITSNLYNCSETSELPADAVAASLGCGNPTALARLNPGETVLDLGSGGGIDVLLSARRVGPTGKAYGLDMTDEMLALARENQKKAGVDNVEFLKGEIEAIPLPDASVDVVISNCVINLSGDKDRVLAEAFRVLRPGGRFAVSDVVVRGEVPAAIRRSVELWIGCVAGALEEQEYRDKLAKAGFEAIGVEPTRVYRVEDAREFLAGSGIDVDAVAPHVEGKFMSAFVRASKPARMGAERILFVCTHNSARSQMAEGLLRHLGGGRVEVASAGTEAHGVNPLAVLAMAEIGIDLRGHTSKTLDRFVGERWDDVITVCDNARESCPVFPGATRHLHWSFDDPSAATGSEDERLAAFRRARDEIRARIAAWLRERSVVAGRRSA